MPQRPSTAPKVLCCRKEGHCLDSGFVGQTAPKISPRFQLRFSVFQYPILWSPSFQNTLTRHDPAAAWNQLYIDYPVPYPQGLITVGSRKSHYSMVSPPLWHHVEDSVGSGFKCILMHRMLGIQKDFQPFLWQYPSLSSQSPSQLLF